MRLFICGPYADASDHAVFPVATIKTNTFDFPGELSQKNGYYVSNKINIVSLLYNKKIYISGKYPFEY
jgi:hypothetical protein